MAGRPKTPMYEYDPKGKFVQAYETRQEVFDKYYQGAKRPLIREGKEYGLLPNGHYICDKRIGRDRIEQLQRIEASKYVAKRELVKDTPVSAYNVAGEKIATFASVFHASVLTGINQNTIHRSADTRIKRSKRYTRKKLDLFFKYENNSVTLQETNQ
jgi:hypothetical protein